MYFVDAFNETRTIEYVLIWLTCGRHDYLLPEGTQEGFVCRFRCRCCCRSRISDLGRG